MLENKHNLPMLQEKIIILCHVDLLIGNDSKTNNYKTDVSRQHHVNSNRGMVYSARSASMAAQATMDIVTEERSFYAVPADVITRTISKS